MKSITKSRSATASMLLRKTRSSPSSLAADAGSSGYGAPARAPPPSGDVEDGRVELRERVDREEPEVQSDLVVTASTRVQLPGDLTDQVSESALDDRVNVLEVGRPGK